MHLPGEGMLDYEARGPASGMFAQVGDKTKAYFGLGVHVSLDRAEANLQRYQWLAGRDVRWRPEIHFVVSDLFWQSGAVL
jgi:hypothetical protein